jgi:hypothetical protein
VSGWDVIVIVAVIAPYVALGAFVLGGIVLALLALRQRKYRSAAACIAAIASPFLVYGAVMAMSDAGAGGRVHEVAAFKRTPMPADHPRTLEIVSHNGASIYLATAMMLTTGEFDRVVWVETPRYPALAYDSVYEMGFARTKDCLKDAATAGDIHLGRGKRPSHFDFSDLDRCVVKGNRTRADRTEFGDAIVLLDDHSQTLRPMGMACRAAELRMRRGGEDVLIDYQEDYCYRRVPIFDPFAGLNDKRKHVKKGVVIRPLWVLEQALHPDQFASAQ